MTLLLLRLFVAVCCVTGATTLWRRPAVPPVSQWARRRLGNEANP